MNRWVDDQLSVPRVAERMDDSTIAAAAAAAPQPSRITTTTTTTTTTTRSFGSIQRLSKEVVDRIAAGEVVQRPAAAVKELLENSLDAKSTHIVIHVENGGLSKLMISDNGCGIGKDDLALAATRFCTSKLCTEQDFATLETFGFRGEALASMSMVSRLSITSRVASSPTAFQQTYLNGEPTSLSSSSSLLSSSSSSSQQQQQQHHHHQPKPCARPVGTTVTCQDLFYNLPQRKTLKESDEYKRILQVAEQYAIQYAGRGVTIVCQRKNKKNNIVDLNTANCAFKASSAASDVSLEKQNEARKEATKKVLAQVIDSKLENRLLYLEHSHNGSVGGNSHDKSNSNETDQMTFRCKGFLSHPSYESSSSSSQGVGNFVLFVNDRLVECQPLKRALESAYAGSTKSKPFLYVSLDVPPTQLDVNVHPTKRQVRLLYMDEICTSIQEAVKNLLSSQQDYAFAKSSVESLPTINPYCVKRKRSDVADEKKEAKTDDADNDDDDNNKPTRKETVGSNSSNKKREAPQPVARKLPPSKMIRTSKASQSGSLEPYLIRTQSLTPLSQSQPEATQSPNEVGDDVTPISSPAPTSQRTHEPDCPLASSNTAFASSIDMTQPGAFAEALRSCSCPSPSSTLLLPPPPSQSVVVRKPRNVVVRPMRVTPTPCTYASIVSLRKHVNKATSPELSKSLREAVFCGVVSQHRSLVQCGMELVLWNHSELGQELFYQLALAKFGGGCPEAKLGAPIDIQIAMAQAMELEEQLQVGGGGGGDASSSILENHNGLLPVSETNNELARQAAACLLSHAEMLLEYFSIRFEPQQQQQHQNGGSNKYSNNSSSSVVLLSGLPVLLEGHAPPPHGLPVFLLRLATEVDWTDEQACFDGICRELGAFYAQVPATDTVEANHYIQHCLFPAISYLVLPPKRFQNDGSIVQLTALPMLYKEFERC